jgi:type I restriction enzyme S subunit
MIKQMTAMPKYEAYKDSGVEWLGDIPKHWEVKKLKYESDVVLGKMLCTENKGNYQLKPYLKSKNIQWLNVDISSVDEMWFSPVEMELYRIKDGDLILSEGGEVGKTCIWNGELEECYIQNSAHKVTFSKQNHSRFFLYLFFIAGNIGLFDSIVNKVSIAHLTRDKLTNIDFVFPPLLEQTAIAAFLDRKTAQIDQAVAIKEKQIALLKERKQILIQNSVTRGLNLDAPMRDSGVEWIGEIPTHWKVSHIKYLGKIINGFAFDSGSFTENGIRVMKISNIQTMSIDWSDASYIHEKYFELYSQFQIQVGDLVFALTRPIISTGIKAAIVNSDEKILLNQRNAVLRPNQKAIKAWLFFIILNEYFVKEFEKQIDRTGQQPNISTQAIGNLKVPIPCVQEQIAIVTHIETQSAKIDKVIALQQQQIDKLKEYKATLINSAVTGKIKMPELSGEKNAA